jgi:hypothetical protein
MTTGSVLVAASRLAAGELAVGVWCGGLDPALLSGGDAVDGAVRVAVMIRRLTAAQAGLAVRVDETKRWKGTQPNAASWLAEVSGTSVGEAHRMLKTQERLGSCPVTKEAFENGELSLLEADVVSLAVEADPSSEVGLVGLAKRKHDLRGLKEKSDQVRRGVHDARAEAERAAKIHASRRWREGRDLVDGSPRVDAKFTAVGFASVKGVIDRFQEQIFGEARRAGCHEPTEAYALDALVAAVIAGGAAVGCPVPAASPTVVEAPAAGKPTAVRSTDEPGPGMAALLAVLAVLAKSSESGSGSRPCVVVDAIALARGFVASGETCEIPGVGPVDVAWACRVMGEAVFDVVIHNGVDIVAFASTTRYVPRAVKVALEVRDRGCVVPNCHHDQRLERDHREDFADTHDTGYRNMGRLCDVHHLEKTAKGARLERHGDEWWWYPPPDPDDPQPPVEPWRGPVGEHLTHWNLDHLPGDPDGESERPDQADQPDAADPPRLDLGPAG